MRSPTAYAFDRQRIIVADGDTATTAAVVSALRRDGHCVAHAPEALLLAPASVLGECHLLISTMQVDGLVRMDLLGELRESLPELPILYLRSAETDEEVPRTSNVTVLRAPFTIEELQQAVRRLLPGLHAGTILALPLGASGGH
jgi:DNA-binding NtrC family response regulator